MNLQFSLILILLLNSLLFSAGLDFWGNRLNGYTTTVINLSQPQQTKLQDLEPKQMIKIALSEAQRIFLEKNSGYSIDSLTIYSQKLAKSTCICESYDIGIAISKNKVEIPHFLLGSRDFDDASFIANCYYQNNVSRYQRLLIMFIIFSLLIIVRKKKPNAHRTKYE